MSEGEIVQWGDDAQYMSAPIKKTGSQVRPTAYLLAATPDPLGVIAAAAKMYKGEPTYDLADITDEERKFYWEDTFKSHLRAPHEFVQFHFFVEGVTRSHTHQMVRQRTATFCQESLRFAVKENLAQETPLPPSIAEGTSAAALWHELVDEIEVVYQKLVNAGIPAEDARGLLPHATTTRLHWRTNLNDLLHHAGNRLCTQAQFEWRYLLASVMKAISEYRPPLADPGPVRTYFPNGLDESEYFRVKDLKSSRWQFELIGQARPHTFAPICYQLGKCQFDSSFDRPCSIRDRVDAFAASGTPSSEWGEGVAETDGGFGPGIEPINYEEWMLNPDAAR